MLMLAMACFLMDPGFLPLILRMHTLPGILHLPSNGLAVLSTSPLLSQLTMKLKLPPAPIRTCTPCMCYRPAKTEFYLTNISSSIDYEEELDRVVRFATAAKEALPGVKVAAPSTCSWWYCELTQYI